MALVYGKTYYVKNYNTGMYLNVYGSDTVSNGRDVTVYIKENVKAQKWVARMTSNGPKLFSTINESFALNINTADNNCTMYTAAGNDTDSVLSFDAYNSAQNIYYIKMANHNKYLGVFLTGSGQSARWLSTSSGYTLWQFEEADFSTAEIPSPVPVSIEGKTFFIKNYNTGKFLNVYGTDTVANARNVNVYDVEDCQAQRWVAKQTSSGGKLFTKIDENYALNINTVDGNCTMYVAAGNDADSVLEFEQRSSDTFYIKMFNHKKYLVAESKDSGRNVSWANSRGSYGLWQFVYAADAIPVPKPVPAAIANGIFFIRNKDTGLNLNVNGTDTVANARNVNTYSKEKCLAQEWIAKQTSAGPTLFTARNDAFALNINTTDNNCTMYTAAGNNPDSVLEFEKYGSSDFAYRIKMFNHNKYLCVENSDEGANVFWTTGTSGHTVWEFVEEDEMFTPADEVPKELADKTFFIRNVSTGCYLNVYGTDTVANNRNVNVYTKEDCLAQRWIPKQTTNGPKLFTAINDAFALNIYTTDSYNCSMYTAAGNDNDSILDIEQYGQSGMIFRIKMHNHERYLTVDGRGSGANAYWSDQKDFGTLWKFETSDEAFPPADKAPEILNNKTFFLRAGDSNFYLNVYGNDTVSNTRNVNVFSLEDCKAQRWVVKQMSRGPKLFTAIDNTYALNIYNDDCTMYIAEGNDMDSILEFEQRGASVNQYRIKMHYHDKYLYVDGTPGAGVDVKWTSDSSKATSWFFIPEGDLDFAELIPSPREADSPLVTRFIPADVHNYTQNRARNGGKISEICIHHAAGNISIDGLGALWQIPTRAGSSHYGVSGTQIGQYVREQDIAWTNGHWESNCRSVTIETSNNSGAPDWTVSDASLNTLIQLVADIAYRNNLRPLVKGVNVTWHQMYAATACPGPYLLSKMQYIVDEANKILESKPTAKYLRQHGTSNFIGIRDDNDLVRYETTINKKVGHVDSISSLPIPFIISAMAGSNDYKAICANNSNLSLKVLNDSLVLSSDTTLPDAIISKSRYNSGRYEIKVADTTSGSTNIFKWIYNSLKELFFSSDEDSSTEYDSVDDVTSNIDSNANSNVPDILKNKFFNIANSSGKYLTLNTGGSAVSMETKNNSENQIWGIMESNGKYIIKSFASPKTLLCFDSDRQTVKPVTIAAIRGNNFITIKEHSTGKMAISFDSVGRSLSSGLKGLINEKFEFIFEEPEPFVMNGWLKFYYNPTYNLGKLRVVEIPKGLPSKTSENGTIISFDNPNDWCTNMDYIYEDEIKDFKYITNEELKSEIKNLPNGTKEIINPYAYQPIYEKMKKFPKIIPLGGAWIDENGRYWIAAGPKVAYESFDGTNINSNEMYGNGYIDAVLEKNGNYYYLPCVIGEIKAHTWDNGVIQTWFFYEDHKCYYKGSKPLDFQSCVEFIGGGTLTDSSQFSIVEIRCYDTYNIG